MEYPQSSGTENDVTPESEGEPEQDADGIDFEQDPLLTPEELDEVDAGSGPFPFIRERIGAFMTERDRDEQVRLSDFHPRDIALILLLLLLVVVFS